AVLRPGAARSHARRRFRPRRKPRPGPRDPAGRRPRRAAPRTRAAKAPTHTSARPPTNREWRRRSVCLPSARRPPGEPPGTAGGRRARPETAARPARWPRRRKQGCDSSAVTYPGAWGASNLGRQRARRFGVGIEGFLIKQDESDRANVLPPRERLPNRLQRNPRGLGHRIAVDAGRDGRGGNAFQLQLLGPLHRLLISAGERGRLVVLAVAIVWSDRVNHVADRQLAAAR